MASLVINSIRSALNALVNRPDIVKAWNSEKLMNYLKNLVTFILCARKLGDDAQLRFDDKESTLGSLLQRIHDAVDRNAREIQIYRGPTAVKKRNFVCDMEYVQKEIGQWHLILSDSVRQPNSPTIDGVTEIIDSILENLADFVRFSFWDSVEPIEAMAEKITFLRNFIRFATLPSVEPCQLEDLLVYIEAVSINAAHISYMIQDCFDAVWPKKMPSDVSVMLQKIKVIDPHVYETYAQALTISKLATQSHSPIDAVGDPLVVMKDFIDFLLWNLWEVLNMCHCHVTELQLFYEGLRLLRTLLKELPNRFGDIIRELTRVLICDAGIVIFLQYQKDFKIFVSRSNQLVRRIKHISEIVQGKNPEMPTSSYPRTNELGFVDFLLENLMGMTSCEACESFQSQFQIILDELSLLRHFLGEIVEIGNEQKELEALWNAGVQVAYRVEFLIDQLVLGDFLGSCSVSSDSIVEDIIKKIKTINLEFYQGSVQDIKVKKANKISYLVSSQDSAPVADHIVGFDDNAPSIIDRLTRGTKQLKIVAIVGMPGLGKTTLATKVYNHPYVTVHFHLRIWCRVSQLFHKNRVLLELLNHIVPNGNLEVSEQELTENLWRHLKRKRYLVFLDDVWDIEVWNCLQASFPDDCCGSRIILTSRLRDVAPQAMLDEEPHFLGQLTNDESLELLQRKLFPGTGWPAALYELGKQIAEKCKGLPLTIVIVSGFLATLELEGWKNVLESLSSGIISSTEQCINTLELSYKHLPEYLKPCFLYFGLFPEGQEVSVHRLIRLWIAEGFVLKTELKSLEDVARDYMKDLVGRSLVIVAKKRSRGGIKACWIHDLLHEFCITKAKEENFFQLLKGYDEVLSFKEPGYLRRLCVHSERKHFKNLRLFRPPVHSLLFFTHDVERPEREQGHDISFIIPRYNRLRVLDISWYFLRFEISSKIELLAQLKYLAVRGYMRDIPSSIGSLSNLETFIFDSPRHQVSLPETFWNLRKMRYLVIESGFYFPIENLENSPALYELQSCSGAIICPRDGTEMLIRKFPNIRKLKFRWLVEDGYKISIRDFPSRLESLHVLSMGYYELYPRPLVGLEFDFAENLRKLNLESLRLHQSGISMIGKLPNLEVLKLYDVDFPGNTWDMVEGEFLTLKFLKLDASGLVRWTALDDQFPYLQKLVLKSCYYLEVIPSCFENIDTLEMIDVSYCLGFVEIFFKRIQDEQLEMGNSTLNVHFSSNWNN